MLIPDHDVVTRFSIRWCFLLETIVMMQVAQWWFLEIPSFLLCLATILPLERTFLFSYLLFLISSISGWIHRPLFWSMASNPLLPLFWCWNCPKPGRGELAPCPLHTFPSLILAQRGSLGSSWLSPAPTWKRVTSPRGSGSFYWRKVFRNQDLGSGSAHVSYFLSNPLMSRQR